MRAPRRNVKKLYNREFSKCNETCQSPDNRFNDTKADGTISNRIFLPPPRFSFLSLSFFSLHPSFFQLGSFPNALSFVPGVTLPFRLLISPSGRFDRVNTGWNIGETGRGGGRHVYAGGRVTRKGSLYWRRFSFEVVNCNSLRI